MVGRNECHSLDTRLGDQDAIEGIPVDRRQMQGRERMVARNREFVPAIGDEPTSKAVGLDLKILSARRMLDCDFPQARGAEP